MLMVHSNELTIQKIQKNDKNGIINFKRIFLYFKFIYI